MKNMTILVTGANRGIGQAQAAGWGESTAKLPERQLAGAAR